MRRLLSLVAALALALSTCSCSSRFTSTGSADVSFVGGDVSVESSFMGRSFADVVADDPGRVVNSAELPGLLAVGMRAAVDTPCGDVVSRGEFLSHLAAYRGGRYFVSDADGGLNYPASSGAFLSASDWDAIRSGLDEPATVGFCGDILARADACDAALRGDAWPRDFEAFSALIRDYYGEFYSLVVENEDAVRYWLENGSFNSECFYFGDFSAVIHEVIHESSARRSGVFAGRDCEDGGWWQVRWTYMPSFMWLFSFSDDAWIEVPVYGIPSVSARSASFEIRSGDLWDRYMGRSYGIPQQGLAGVLQEMQSTVAELRMNVISVSLGHMYYYLPQKTLDAYYFWKGLLLSSLAESEGGSSYLPAEVKSYVVDLISYAEGQLSFYPGRVMLSDYGARCRDWAESNAWVLGALS